MALDTNGVDGPILARFEQGMQLRVSQTTLAAAELFGPERQHSATTIGYGNTTASDRPASSAISIARVVVVPKTNPC
jgi:hypothetical protein